MQDKPFTLEPNLIRVTLDKVKCLLIKIGYPIFNTIRSIALLKKACVH